MNTAFKLFLKTLAWTLFGMLVGSGILLSLYIWQETERLQGSEAFVAGLGALIAGLFSLMYKLHKDAYVSDKGRISEDIDHAMRMAAEGDAEVEESLSKVLKGFREALDRDANNLQDLKADTEARHMELKRQIEDYRRESWHAIDGFRREITEFRKDSVTKQDLQNALNPIHSLLTELLLRARNEKTPG